MKKSLIVIGLMLGMALIAVGCGPQATGEEQVVTYNVGTEPETLDPALMTGIPEFHMTLQTVSYTHLDVYKRQALMWRWGGKERHLCLPVTNCFSRSMTVV